MASRETLELEAAAVGINPDSYPNDSKLEQAILYAASNLAPGAVTVAAPSARAVKNAASGKKNV
jgi:hypothetical protein